MKKQKKRRNIYRELFFLAVLSCFTTSVYSQQVHIGFGPELLAPAGNSSNISSIGGGILAKAEVQVSDNLGILGQVGYNHFIGRRYLGERSDQLKYIPVKLGLKYYADQSFYIEGQLGANLPQNNIESTSVAWSIGFGSKVGRVRNDQFFDLGLRYEGWSKKQLINTSGKLITFGFFAVRLTYNFNL